MHQYLPPIIELPTVLDRLPSPEEVRAELAVIERRKRILKQLQRVSRDAADSREREKAQAAEREGASHDN